MLWAAFPIVFFSFSQSKLPGYILPAVPPITILCGDYLNRRRKRGLKMPLLTIHSIVVGALVAATLMLPMILIHPHQWPPMRIMLAAMMEGTAVAIAILVVVVRFGLNRLRVATLVPVALVLVFLLGTRNGTLLDQKYSARTLAREIAALPDAPHLVAVYQARRDVQYGLGFYLNERVSNYQRAGVPPDAHLLVVQDFPNQAEEQHSQDELKKLLADRPYEPLFFYRPQDLTVYRVSPKSQ